jgi:hypothetical protein
MIYSDSGKEFMGKCKVLFKEQNIYHKTDRSDMGASLVERFNRTLRLKMERYISWAKTNNFLPVLQDLVMSYNNTIHPIHGRTPADVYYLSKASQKSIYRDVEEIEFENWEKEDYVQQLVKFKFKLGDYVRIMIEKNVFNKATGMKRWSDVLYQVVQLIPTIPPTYKVKPLDGEMNDKNYYKEDMQKVNAPEPVEIKTKIIEQKLVQETKPKEGNPQQRESLPRNVKVAKEIIEQKKPEQNNKEKQERTRVFLSRKVKK